MHDGVDGVVGASRIKARQDEAIDTNRSGDGDGVFPRRMAPTAVIVDFFRQVLTVIDQHLHAPDRLNDRRVSGGTGFVISHDRHTRRRSVDPVADSTLRMLNLERCDLQTPNFDGLRDRLVPNVGASASTPGNHGGVMTAVRVRSGSSGP